MEGMKSAIEKAQSITAQDTKKYFSTSEWEALEECEKIRYTNILQLYHVKLACGFESSEVPSFIMKSRQKGSVSNQKSEISGAPKKKKEKKVNYAIIPSPGSLSIPKPRFLKSPSTITYTSSSATRIDHENSGSRDEHSNKSPQPHSGFPISGLSIGSQPDSNSRSPQYPGIPISPPSNSESKLNNADEDSRRYPQRNVRAVCYREDPIPDDDEFYFCYHCNDFVLGLLCKEHGKPFRVIDNEVPSYCKDRAQRSLPGGLEIKESRIPGAGLGVFPKVWVPKSTILGPYEGRISKKTNNGGYCWELERTGRTNDCVDAQDTRVANWTRYMNCATHMTEQNLEPFQYKGQIFFRTLKDIYHGQEMLVWYGEEYMVELGINVENYFEQKSSIPSFPGLIGNKCRFCSLNYSNVTTAQRHVQLKHGSQQALMVIQYKATTMFPPSNYNQHPVPASSYPIQRGTDGLFACPVCGKTTKTKTTMIQHIRVHTNERPYKCDVCTQAFTQEDHLIKHKRIHTGERLHQCTHCDQSFSDISNLTTHTLVCHSKEKPYKCKFCDYSSAVQSVLKTHIQAIHLKERPFACTECSYAYSTSGSLKRHIQAIHRNKRPFACTECSYTCTTSGNLKTHIQAIHLKERPFACTECSYTCTTSGNLKKHIQAIHLKERPFACTECSYTCTKGGDLKRHTQAVHLKERPFECTECSYTCTQSFDLKRHTQIVHLKERPFACTECSYAYSTSGSLKRHTQAIHLNEKPFACTECSYTCTQGGDLKRHTQAVHLKERPFACTECSYACSTSGSLKRHIQAIHLKEKTICMC